MQLPRTIEQFVIFSRPVDPDEAKSIAGLEQIEARREKRFPRVAAGQNQPLLCLTLNRLSWGLACKVHLGYFIS